jgi:hypothetical protein
LCRVLQIATRTGVHRRGEHEPSREDGGAGGARDSDDAFLEWLSRPVEHLATELRRFVEKEHAVVLETDLARSRQRGPPPTSATSEAV